MIVKTHNFNKKDSGNIYQKKQNCKKTQNSLFLLIKTIKTKQTQLQKPLKTHNSIKALKK